MPETSSPIAAWATLSRDARDAAFDNQRAIGPAQAKALIEGYAAASQLLLQRRPPRSGLAYGPGARHGIDLFPAADPAAPCLVFLFGGYWQRNNRQSFSCVAEGLLAHGWSAAFPDYSLTPDVSLTTIAEEIRAALDWLAREGAAHGIAGPVILSGWSAGGHLTALSADHPRVAAAMPVSGLFELGPLRDVPSVNDKLRLTDTEVETLSPQRLAPTAKPVCVAYGTAELPALVANSRDFHAHRAAHHQSGALLPVAGADHFTILEQFRSPDGLLTRAALALAQEVSATR